VRVTGNEMEQVNLGGQFAQGELVNTVFVEIVQFEMPEVGDKHPARQFVV
jgi:hypothetical protein